MSIRNSLTLLAGAFGVSLRDLDDDALQIVAVRVISETGDDPSAFAFRRIVDEVRRAEGREDVAGSRAATTSEQRPESARTSARPSASHRCDGCTPRWLAHTPSGGGFFHEKDCPIAPHQKIPRTDAGQKRARAARTRLIQEHRAEDARTALYIVPTPVEMNALKAHPACISAWRDGGVPCGRCEWLLEDEPYTEAHLDDADDLGGRL